MGDKAIGIGQKADEDAEKQQQKKWPPMKITTKIKGVQKDYSFLKTVKSVEELDKFRFKNYGRIENSKTLPAFTSSLIIQCTRKKRFKGGKQCNFELLALRQASDTIHVYAYSEHNHPMMPEEKRAIVRRAKQLMPVENPPDIFRTEDNIEWKFVQTLPDYAQLQGFQRKSQCIVSTGRESHRRVRQPCCRKNSHNCQFKLLALKTTKKGYHVYTFGEHNHPTIKPKKKQQPAARGRQQKQQEMEVDEQEEDEVEESEEEDEEVEGQEEPIEEGGGGGEEDDDNDIIIIDDDGIQFEQQQQAVKIKQEGPNEEIATETPRVNEAAQDDDIIVIELKVKPKQGEGVKQEVEGSMEKPTAETPLKNEPNPAEETWEEAVQKAKVNACYEWMARFKPNQIEPKVMGMNMADVLEMVKIADQEVRQHPAKFDQWYPWLDVAMKKKKCIKTEGFYAKYEHLITMVVVHS